MLQHSLLVRKDLATPKQGAGSALIIGDEVVIVLPGVGDPGEEAQVG
jgi:hypothetical protein